MRTTPQSVSAAAAAAEALLGAKKAGLERARARRERQEAVVAALEASNVAAREPARTRPACEGARPAVVMDPPPRRFEYQPPVGRSTAELLSVAPYAPTGTTYAEWHLKTVYGEHDFRERVRTGAMFPPLGPPQPQSPPSATASSSRSPTARASGDSAPAQLLPSAQQRLGSSWSQRPVGTSHGSSRGFSGASSGASRGGKPDLAYISTVRPGTTKAWGAPSPSSSDVASAFGSLDGFASVAPLVYSLSPIRVAAGTPLTGPQSMPAHLTVPGAEEAMRRQRAKSRAKSLRSRGGCGSPERGRARGREGDGSRSQGGAGGAKSRSGSRSRSRSLSRSLSPGVGIGSSSREGLGTRASARSTARSPASPGITEEGEGDEAEAGERRLGASTPAIMFWGRAADHGGAASPLSPQVTAIRRELDPNAPLSPCDAPVGLFWRDDARAAAIHEGRQRQIREEHGAAGGAAGTSGGGDGSGGSSVASASLASAMGSGGGGSEPVSVPLRGYLEAKAKEDEAAAAEAGVAEAARTGAAESDSLLARVGPAEQLLATLREVAAKGLLPEGFDLAACVAQLRAHKAHITRCFKREKEVGALLAKEVGHLDKRRSVATVGVANAQGKLANEHAKMVAVDAELGATRTVADEFAFAAEASGVGGEGTGVLGDRAVGAAALRARRAALLLRVDKGEARLATALAVEARVHKECDKDLREAKVVHMAARQDTVRAVRAHEDAVFALHASVRLAASLRLQGWLRGRIEALRAFHRSAAADAAAARSERARLATYVTVESRLSGLALEVVDPRRRPESPAEGKRPVRLATKRSGGFGSGGGSGCSGDCESDLRDLGEDVGGLEKQLWRVTAEGRLECAHRGFVLEVDKIKGGRAAKPGAVVRKGGLSAARPAEDALSAGAPAPAQRWRVLESSGALWCDAFEPRKCALCDKPNAPQVCQTCKSAAYCDDACQRGHASSHRTTCTPPEDEGFVVTIKNGDKTDKAELWMNSLTSTRSQQWSFGRPHPALVDAWVAHRMRLRASSLKDVVKAGVAARAEAAVASRKRAFRAAVAIQCLARVAVARRSAKRRHAANFDAILDGENGQVYYWNRVTGETTWDRPPLFRDDLVAVTANTSDIEHDALAVKTPRTPRPKHVPETPDEAAVMLQRLYRARLARRKVVALAKATYEKLIDEASGAVFYYNAVTGESQWTKPGVLGSTELELGEPEPEKTPRTPRPKHVPETPDEAASVLQRLYRARLARRRVVELTMATFEKVFDEESGAYFYYNEQSGESQWTKPRALGADEDVPVFVGSVTGSMLDDGDSARPQSVV